MLSENITSTLEQKLGDLQGSLMDTNEERWNISVSQGALDLWLDLNVTTDEILANISTTKRVLEENIIIQSHSSSFPNIYLFTTDRATIRSSMKDL